MKDGSVLAVIPSLLCQQYGSLIKWLTTVSWRHNAVMVESLVLSRDLAGAVLELPRPAGEDRAGLLPVRRGEEVDVCLERVDDGEHREILATARLRQRGGFSVCRFRERPSERPFRPLALMRLLPGSFEPLPL